MAQISLLAGTGRRRHYGFALTPLADAMFQLLIFFMLSSSLSPFSLMTLTTGRVADRARVPAPVSSADPARMVIWQLYHGAIRSGSETYALADHSAIAASLGTRDADQIVVFPTRSATVQDVATVLELLGSHGITNVRLIAGSTVGGE